MYVYRCTLYTTLQNAGWRRKAGYSLSAVSAHFLRNCGHYLRMISCLLENESRVLPGMRKRGVAPRSRYMSAYIHLVRTCCPRSARRVLPLVAKKHQQSQKSFKGSAAVRSTSIFFVNKCLKKKENHPRLS